MRLHRGVARRNIPVDASARGVNTGGINAESANAESVNAGRNHTDSEARNSLA